MGWKEFTSNVKWIFSGPNPKAMTGKGRLSRGKKAVARAKASATLNRISRTATAGFRYQIKKRGMAVMRRPARW